MSEANGRDLLAALDKHTGSTHPESWKPEVGEEIVGELIEYREGKARHGAAQIAVIREDGTDTPRAVWLFHTVMLAEFKRLKPKPGERLAIRRLEDGQKGEHPYRRFAVVVDREEHQGELPDFDSLEPADKHAPNPFD